MVFSVQFIIHRKGEKALHIGGLYTPPPASALSIEDGIRQVTEFIRVKLKEKGITEAHIEVKSFRRHQTDFFFSPESLTDWTGSLNL
jgi:hypothetical protein